MSDRYGEVRRPEYGTLGDGYRMYNKCPDAFVAGAQYVLDKLNSTHGPVVTVSYSSPEMAEYLNGWSAEILRRALEGEPQ